MEIKNILNAISDPVDRLEFVMDVGNHIPQIPRNHAGTEISGCASLVEIYDDGKGNFYGFADSALVRGVLAILLFMIQGKTKAEIKKMDLLAEFNSLNLKLGAGRMNGVNGIINYLQS